MKKITVKTDLLKKSVQKLGAAMNTKDKIPNEAHSEPLQQCNVTGRCGLI